MLADDADDERCDIDEERNRNDRAAAMEAASVLPPPHPGCGAAAPVDALKTQACVAPAPDGWVADAASTLLDFFIA